MQELVGQLRTELTDAREGSSSAAEALNVSTELAGRLQAAAEMSTEQAAAAAQRVAHQHSRSVADFEHRLQQATAALQHSTETATAADAERLRSIQSLQQLLDKALDVNSVSASRNNELAGSVQQLTAQLEAAQSAAAAQAADSQLAVVELQIEVDRLKQQLSGANKATDAALTVAAAKGSQAEAQADIEAALQQASQEHNAGMQQLEQRLLGAQTALQSTVAAAAQADMENKVHRQLLQQRLGDAVEQGLVAQGQVYDSAGKIAELQLQLESAQGAFAEKARANQLAVDELQSERDTVRQQMADANQAATAAAADAASLLRRTTTAEASLLESAAALTQEELRRSHLINAFQEDLKAAKAALHQSVHTAAQTDAERLRVIQGLQQQLSDAVESAQAAQGANKELTESVRSLGSELSAAEASLLREQQVHASTRTELQSQVKALQHQHATAQQAAEAAAAAAASADSRAASAEASAWEGSTALQATLLEKDQLASQLEQQLQAAQAALQQTTESAALADVQRQKDLHMLQQRLDDAIQQGSASLAVNTQLSDSVQQLKIQLQYAQNAVAKQSESTTAIVSQLQCQVDVLQQQVTSVRAEADTAAAKAATLQQAAAAASQCHEEASALLHQTLADKEQLVSALEHRLTHSQTELQQALNAAAVTSVETQHTVQSLQTRLDSTVQQAVAVQTANGQLSETVQQLKVQMQYGRNLMAKQSEASESTVTELHSHVQALQQHLSVARQEAVAATAEAAALTDASAVAQASQQAALTMLQASATGKEAMVGSFQEQLQDAQSALHQRAESAARADAENQATLQSLQQRLDNAMQQQAASSSTNAELCDKTQQLTAQLASAQTAAVELAAAHDMAAADMLGQVTSLQQQLATACEAADATAAHAATLSQRLTASEAAQASAQEAEEPSQQQAVEQQRTVDDLQLRLQDAQSELQQSTLAVAAAEEKRKGDMQLLQQRLDAALESVNASQTSSAESAEVIADLKAQLGVAQAAASAQVEAFAARADGLQQQVSCLGHHSANVYTRPQIFTNSFHVLST